jgi:hypothetical protein
VAGSKRDEDADLIVSGREPRRRSLRPAGLVWLLVGVQAAALAVAVAVHYRSEAGRLGPGVPQATSLSASPMPQVTSAALRLPASGGVAGTVVITAAVLPGAVRAQFTVSAVITGGTPGTVYDLIGSDCTTADPRPDEVWATGLTGADGTADLAGYAWTGAVADRYWMALDPSPLSHPPGLHGQFAQGRAAPFPAGQVPCALTSGSPHWASEPHPVSAIDVGVADVTLVGLLQLGRTRRLHVVADRSELKLAEVQRFLLPGAQRPALR